MTFPRPSLPQFRTTIRQRFQARFPTADLTQPNSVIGVLCDIIAGTAYSEFGYLDWISQQVLPDTAETDYLDRWANIFGLTRNAALVAAGNVIFSGVTGAMVPIGTNVQDSNGDVYITQPTFTVLSALLLTGGSGYTNGTTNLTVVGGSGTTAAVINVTIAGGIVTTVNSITTHGSYVQVPSPATVTGGGSGTGATFSLNTAVEAAGATVGSAGTATVQVIAAVPGAAANQNPNAPVTLVAVLTNILGNATFDAGGATGGTDQESDASLRARVLTQIQQPPQGGSSADYIEWTLATPVVGATRVFVYPQGLAGNVAGSVAVLFVCDGRSTPTNPAAIIPTAADVDLVAGFINNLRPVTAIVTVIAPIAVTVNFALSITPSNPTTQAGVVASLFNLFARLSTPGGTIFSSQIIDAIMQVPGIVHCSVTSPAGDINVNSGGTTPANFGVLGTVTFS